MIRVRVISSAGSAPRDSGAEMLVGLDHLEGTIGGGALEWEAIRIARDMIENATQDHRQVFPLGPNLGQCCGGSVTLGFAQAESLTDTRAQALWIWGAGHVGRALVSVIGPLNRHAITWVDTGPERFPESIPSGVDPLVAADPILAVAHAPQNADHLIVTYSHDLDLKLCDALLRHGFDSCGLIGSATKWTRFKSRLSALGHTSAQISRIACPIGDPSLGKEPQAIAVGVAATLISAGAQNTIQRNVRGGQTG